MPQKRNTERVVVVRTDIDGNVIDYDVVDQPPPSRSGVIRRPSQLNRSQQIEKSPRPNQIQIYDDEGEEELEDDEDIPIFNDSLKQSSRDSTARSTATPRRVRYVRPKSTVKIFQEKVEWNAGRKIDSRNHEGMKKIREPTKKIINQHLSWSAHSKIDSHNDYIINNYYRAPKIFSEKPVWSVQSKVDTHNEDVAESILRAPKSKIYNEHMNWSGISSKVDAHNEDAVNQIKHAPKPTIYDEKLEWSATGTMNTYNREYIEHKQRTQMLREQSAKSRTQSFSQPRKKVADKPRIDDYNAEFIEHKKRAKASKLPPIEDRKLEWEKKSRINQRNDAYIERIGQKRSIPIIFREKVHWRTKTPKIDHHNEQFIDSLKKHKKPKIINKLPHWNDPQPKIDSYNDAYVQNTDSYVKPVIVNEKLNWRARSKIDTGLEPEFDEDEHDDDDLTS